MWTFDGMPANILMEADDTVDLVHSIATNDVVETLEDGSTVTNYASLVTQVALCANDTNGDHTMVARLYEGGPILDSATLNPFWVQDAVDGYFWVVERYEDSQLWEVEMVTKNVPDTVDIHIKVIVGGVVLDDYTMERWITNVDLDDIGEYAFRLFHPDSAGSTCHTVKLYQDDTFIGEAFYNDLNDIEEK
jgi:hypothetical protein